MRHRLFNEFTWMSEEDGILEAQGYLQVNGDFRLSTVWGWFRNSATIRLTASLSVTQGSTTTRSEPYTILSEFEEGGAGAGWWGASRNGFIDEDEIVLVPPAMEIVRDDWVQFTFEIEGYIEADDGAEATLNIADGPREVNMPGVTFRVS